MNRRKAQTLTADFVAGLSVFAVVIILSMTVWNVAESKKNWGFDIDRMQKKSMTVADALVTGAGEPESWDNETVTLLGFSESDRVLNKTKLFYFRDVPYGDAKALMGLDSDDFRLEITGTDGKIVSLEPSVWGRIAYFATQSPNDVAFLDALKNYTGAWDFYFGGGNAPANKARFVYNSSDKAGIFKLVIKNASSYDTIIYEDGHVKDTDLTAQERQNLSDFVSNGGTYFHIQHDWEILRTFGFLDSDFGTDKDIGKLVKKDTLFRSLNVGDQRTFQQPARTIIISSVPAAMSVTPIMVDPADSGLCLACKFGFGLGNIYYMPDASDSGGSPMGGFSPTGISLEYGKGYGGADNIVRSERIVFVNDSGILRRVKVNIILWRKL